MTKRLLNLPLNPLRAFAVASRHKTFTAAAQELGVSQVAISRQITILENYLDVSLFERGSRSVRLTETGRTFGAEVAVLFDDIESVTQRILSRETQSTVNLRVYPTFAHFWLMSRLMRFYDRYPETRVRFDTRVEPLDFRGNHLDVAVQLGTGPWRDGRQRKLFDETIDVVCSREYCEKLGLGLDCGGFSEATLLESRYRRRAWEQWGEKTKLNVGSQQRIEFDTSLLTISAAENSFGLAVGQMELMRPWVGTGKLVTPFNRPVPTGSSFYIIWPTTSSVNLQTKRFIDWMLEEAAQVPEFFRAA